METTKELENFLSPPFFNAMYIIEEILKTCLWKKRLHNLIMEKKVHAGPYFYKPLSV